MGYFFNTLRDEWTKEILEPIPRLGTQQLNRGSGVNSPYIYIVIQKKACPSCVFLLYHSSTSIKTFNIFSWFCQFTIFNVIFSYV